MMTSAQRPAHKICRRVVEEKDQRKFIELLQELQLLFVRSEKQKAFSSSRPGPRFSAKLQKCSTLLN